MAGGGWRGEGFRFRDGTRATMPPCARNMVRPPGTRRAAARCEQPLCTHLSGFGDDARAASAARHRRDFGRRPVLAPTATPDARRTHDARHVRSQPPLPPPAPSRTPIQRSSGVTTLARRRVLEGRYSKRLSLLEIASRGAPRARLISNVKRHVTNVG